MGENPKMASHKAKLQSHLNEAASYGGHDGRGGPQKPRGQALKNPSPTGTMLRENVPSENRVPVAGPANMAGNPTGPMGSGGSSGAGS